MVYPCETTLRFHRQTERQIEAFLLQGCTYELKDRKMLEGGRYSCGQKMLGCIELSDKSLVVERHQRHVKTPGLTVRKPDWY